jgi:hypothetical protein
MMERHCPVCHRLFAARQGTQYCSTKCRVAAARKRNKAAAEGRNELARCGRQALDAITSIHGIGQLASDAHRARGTLKQIWINVSEILLELGVTREELCELLK